MSSQDGAAIRTAYLFRLFLEKEATALYAVNAADEHPLLSKPSRVSADIDHRHCPAELELLDQLEQERRRGLALGHELIGVVGPAIEVPVRGNAP